MKQSFYFFYFYFSIYCCLPLGSDRIDSGSSQPLPTTLLTKPYDWTYTTTYAGHTVSSAENFTPRDPEDSDHTIPIHDLTRQDPILFYAEVPLFEDELHDNGASIFSVKIVSIFKHLLAKFNNIHSV